MCDLSPAARNAAWRAAVVARDLGTSLRLLHPLPHGRRAAEAAEALDRLAADLRHRIGIDVQLDAVAGDPLRATVDASRHAAMVVLGSRRGNPLREWVLGTQAERLIRLSAAPVLVVKREARATYRRMLVPLDFQPGAGDAIALATALARAPLVEVFHALQAQGEVSMRAGDVPEATVRSLRQKSVQRARDKLHELIDAARLQGPAVVAGVGFGDPAALVIARASAMRADAVVIGKRRRGLLADFFLGGVTQRVLAAAKTDVLVLRLQEPARLQQPLPVRQPMPLGRA